MTLPMKRNILLILVSAVLLACTTKNKAEKQRTNAFTNNFFAYYNTLFNGKEAMNEEIKNRKSQHQDNFYNAYISIFTFENEYQIDEANKGASLFMNRAMPDTNDEKSALQIAEAKALKTIAKYSVMKNGLEKNNTIFDASILLTRARLYQNKPLEALDALNYLFTNMPNDKRIGLARIYQAQALAKMGDYYRANEIFLTLDNLKKKYQKLKTIYYAEMLIAWDKKEEASIELENAFRLNKNRELRSRIAFLRGQILSNLGKSEEARESFATAYKYASDFEFEVKSQIEIAKTFGSQSDNYEEAQAYIEKISKKGTYASRKNEFLYAQGILAQKAGKEDQAQEYYKKALREKISDGQIRGLTFYEIAEYYFKKNDYIAAGAYYDSAISVMTYKPERQRLEKLSKGIKKITQNYYLIKKNDSILALTRMPNYERKAFFEKHIALLKEKELKEEALAKEEARKKKDVSSDEDNYGMLFTNNLKGFQDFGNQSKGFYFANATTMAKGEATFRQIWGNRSLQDNWRYSAKAKNIDDTKNIIMGIENAKDPRRFDTEFYIEKIPTDEKEIAQLKKDRDTASLGLGQMYHNILSNTSLATKTLYNLIDAKPERDVMLQALYQIFSMNYEKKPQASERAKQIILSDFPYTPYAEFVRNPKNTVFQASSPEVEELYKQVFHLYEEEKYEEAKTVIHRVLETYQQDALIPKFTLLNAYITGKTVGKEVMILQLEQIALNYPRSAEGKKAEEVLKFLKSDLKAPEIKNEEKQITPVTEINNQLPPPPRREPKKKDKPKKEQKNGLPSAPPSIPKGIFG